MSSQGEITFRPPIGPVSGWAWVLTGIIGLLVLLPLAMAVRTVWGAATLEYAVTSERVEIPFGPTTVEIPLDQIVQVYQVTPTKARRHFGTGLPGLKEGQWSFAETGVIRLYATTTSPLTVIATADQKWGISPADFEGFVRAVERREQGRFVPAEAGGSQNSHLVALFVAVGLPLALIPLMLYLFRVPRTIRYTLTEQALVITIGFGRHRIPYDRITGAVVKEPPGIAWRTFGASLPGLYWGSFAWKAAGPHLRLYATRLRPLVLIFTDRTTYGITPIDQEGFVQALHAKIKAVK